MNAKTNEWKTAADNGRDAETDANANVETAEYIAAIVERGSVRGTRVGS